MTPAPSLSLSEAAAMARLAARGGGLPWDLADEAGRAVRLLCTVGIDGCAALAALLADLHARRDENPAPERLTDRVWAASGGALCPIRAGTALSDMARALPADGVGMVGVLMPVLIAPFAADAARALQVPMTLSWHGGILSLGPDGLPAPASLARLAPIRQTGLHIHPGGPGAPAARPVPRAHPDPAAWSALQTRARRTAAASEAPT